MKRALIIQGFALAGFVGGILLASLANLVTLGVALFTAAVLVWLGAIFRIQSEYQDPPMSWRD